MTLHANNSLRFLKKSFRFIIKMTLTDELKVLDNKIKLNQGQYDLGRQAAKMFALSSGELKKYEYITGQDLGNQEQLKKLNLNILHHWVKFLIKD